MLSSVRAFATDYDFGLMYDRQLVSYLGGAYRALRKINTKLTEGLVSLPNRSHALRLLEYLAEGTLLNPRIFHSHPVPLANPFLVGVFSRYAPTGVFSRRFNQQIEDGLNQGGYRPHIKVVVGRDDVGIGVTRKEYIPECICRLGVEPRSVLVASDSPSDLIKAKSVGAITCGIPGGYHSKESLEKTKPDFGVRPINEILSMLLQEVM